METRFVSFEVDTEFLNVIYMGCGPSHPDFNNTGSVWVKPKSNSVIKTSQV
jgi:hypothetical protein